MTIVTRFLRILKADLHGILDNIEEPEVILKQSIRDMQDEIERANKSIARLSKQEESLQHSQQDHQLRIQQLDEQLQLCLHEANDVLAKSVIKKKLQCEAMIKQINRQLDTVHEAKSVLIKETHERLEKLQSIQDKLSLFSNPPHESEPNTESSAFVSGDEVEVTFLREKKRHAEAIKQGDLS